MSQDDDTRAALWREQQRRRVNYQARLVSELAGSRTADAELRARWEPLVAWLHERQEPEVPPEVELDPIGISEQVNVGL